MENNKYLYKVFYNMEDMVYILFVDNENILASEYSSCPYFSHCLNEEINQRIQTKNAKLRRLLLEAKEEN